MVMLIDFFRVCRITGLEGVLRLSAHKASLVYYYGYEVV